MSEPIRTKESRTVRTEFVEQEWTYEELIELFPDEGDSVVNPLVRRCQQYEAEIERLRALVDDLVAAHGDATTAARAAAKKSKVERLRTENADLRARGKIREEAVPRLYEEIERLRAALETIRITTQDGFSDHMLNEIHLVAREALGDE